MKPPAKVILVTFDTSEWDKAMQPHMDEPNWGSKVINYIKEKSPSIAVTMLMLGDNLKCRWTPGTNERQVDVYYETPD